jgi:hypothetical protein
MFRRQQQNTELAIEMEEYRRNRCFRGAMTAPYAPLGSKLLILRGGFGFETGKTEGFAVLCMLHRDAILHSGPGWIREDRDRCLCGVKRREGCCFLVDSGHLATSYLRSIIYLSKREIRTTEASPLKTRGTLRGRLF